MNLTNVETGGRALSFAPQPNPLLPFAISPTASDTQPIADAAPAGPLVLSRASRHQADDQRVMQDVVGLFAERNELRPAEIAELRTSLEALMRTTSWSEAEQFSNSKAQKYGLAKMVATLVVCKQGHYGAADLYGDDPKRREVFSNTLHAILSGKFVVRALDEDQFNEFHRTGRRPTGRTDDSTPPVGAFQTTDRTLNRPVIVFPLDDAAQIHKNYGHMGKLLHEANHAIYDLSEHPSSSRNPWTAVVEEFRAYAVEDFLVGRSRPSLHFLNAIANRDLATMSDAEKEGMRDAYPHIVQAYQRDNEFRRGVDTFLSLAASRPDEATPDQLAGILRNELERNTWRIDLRRGALPFLRQPQSVDNLPP